MVLSRLLTQLKLSMPLKLALYGHCRVHPPVLCYPEPLMAFLPHHRVLLSGNRIPPTAFGSDSEVLGKGMTDSHEELTQVPQRGYT